MLCRVSKPHNKHSAPQALKAAMLEWGTTRQSLYHTQERSQHVLSMTHARGQSIVLPVAVPMLYLWITMALWYSTSTSTPSSSG